MILGIKTDNPEAEIYLLDAKGEIVANKTWLGHKELSITIHKKIDELLESNGISWKELTGIVVFKGPGSFTGLRIGITVANAFAYAQGIPVIGSEGEEWLSNGFQKIDTVKLGQIAMPEYGGEANITKPRK